MININNETNKVPTKKMLVNFYKKVIRLLKVHLYLKTRKCM